MFAIHSIIKGHFVLNFMKSDYKSDIKHVSAHPKRLRLRESVSPFLQNITNRRWLWAGLDLGSGRTSGPRQTVGDVELEQYTDMIERPGRRWCRYLPITNMRTRSCSALWWERGKGGVGLTRLTHRIVANWLRLPTIPYIRKNRTRKSSACRDLWNVLGLPIP